MLTATASGPLTAIAAEFERDVDGAAGLGHPVDEAELEAALGGDRRAGERKLHRDAVGDLAGQAQEGAAGRDDRPLHFGMPSLAPRAATSRSQASAISSPPATANPSMAAMTGLRGGCWTMPANPRVACQGGRRSRSP